MTSILRSEQEERIFSQKSPLFARVALLVNVCLLSLTISCGDDNEGPTGPSKEGNVLLSVGGSSTEFEEFKFSASGLSVIVLSIKAADTLLISIVDRDSTKVNTAIALEETAFEGGPLLIIAIFGSGGYVAVSGWPSTGSLTFTTIDTAQSIAGSFSDGASLVAFKLPDSVSLLKASIEGSFNASKGAVLYSLAKRVRELSEDF